MRGTNLVAVDCDVPLTGNLGLAAGLIIGTAGKIRPLLGAALAAPGASLVMLGAGGANASATLGFDSVGGGGPF